MALRPSSLVLSGVVLTAAIALVGCSPQEDALPTPNATKPPTAAPTETAEPSETTAPTVSTPVTTACDVLISPQSIYDFNPNFSLLSGWKPAAGTAAADAAALDGAVCRWQNDTSGDTIDVSVASLDTGSLERLANETYDDSTMVPTYGGEGYFAVIDGAGQAVVFDRSYWIVVSSLYFMEPGDAEALVSSVVSALP